MFSNQLLTSYFEIAITQVKSSKAEFKLDSGLTYIKIATWELLNRKTTSKLIDSAIIHFVFETIHGPIYQYTTEICWLEMFHSNLSMNLIADWFRIGP